MCYNNNGDGKVEEKYIELILKRCLKVSSKTPLFVNYNKINAKFVKKLTSIAEDLGVSDIYLDEQDQEHIHDILENSSLKELEKCQEFNCAKWDEYAKKDAAFLMLESEIPGLMDNIDPDKIAKSASLKRTTKPIYKEKQLKSEIPWCIACVPNKKWAQKLFPDSNDALKDFWDCLAKICMFDKEDPIAEWDNFLDKQREMADKLNNLQISKLYYKNDLGTDLTIELCEKALWQNASSGEWIVNIPSYETFTTPDYRKTNGVVYSSKPLIYNGQTIDKFWVEFKDGKVVNYDAEVGKDTLKGVIESDDYSCYLGEVALVDYDSPISNTNIVFGTTLIDENASCHIALGSGFLECLENGNDLKDDELEDLGFNKSKNHVDFMIGTEDLTIEADTKEGHITIMENGNIVL